MTQHAEIRILPYSAEQMFNLVADVEKYPLFLPWCQSARIISRNENSFIADLTIGYKSFTHTFRSHVFLNEPAEIRDAEGAVRIVLWREGGGHGDKITDD